MAYTPQTVYNGGMMSKGLIETSTDGKNWIKADTFDFGNLINDPSKRMHYLKQTITARYIRITASEITGQDQSLTIAELDFF